MAFYLGVRAMMRKQYKDYVEDAIQAVQRAQLHNKCPENGKLLSEAYNALIDANTPMPPLTERK